MKEAIATLIAIDTAILIAMFFWVRRVRQRLRDISEGSKTVARKAIELGYELNDLQERLLKAMEEERRRDSSR